MTTLVQNPAHPRWQEAPIPATIASVTEQPYGDGAASRRHRARAAVASAPGSAADDIPTPSEVDAATAVELHTIARELRQRRQLLGLSQVQLSELSGVSRTLLNRVEAERRVPSVRTYARLRAALGLEAPPATLIPTRIPTRLDTDLVAALCAGLLMRREAALADLASALGLSIAAVRENLEAVAERLRPVGFALTDDGGSVRLWPLAGRVSEMLAALAVTEADQTPSPEQVEILGLVAYFGQLPRSLIEHYRQEDSASVLHRMERRRADPAQQRLRDSGGRCCDASNRWPRPLGARPAGGCRMTRSDPIKAAQEVK